jgi:hypothetical protein
LSLKDNKKPLPELREARFPGQRRCYGPSLDRLEPTKAPEFTDASFKLRANLTSDTTCWVSTAYDRLCDG